MPRDEAAVGIIAHLGESVAKYGLGAKIHVTKEKLAKEVGGKSSRFRFRIGFYDIVGAPVEFTYRERAEVQVPGQ